MSKTYKGYELLKAIAEGKIKDGAKIEIIGRFQGDLMGSYFVYNEGSLDYIIYTPNGEQYEEVELFDLLNYRFELIEDEINIQEIEELNIRDKDYIRGDIYEVVKNNREAIVELQKAIKQLDKKIKEK